MNDDNSKARRSAVPAAQPSYDVGYGKPPIEGQFRKGKSGNPRGRPRGSGRKVELYKPLKYELSKEVLKDTFLEEAYRLVNINTGQGDEAIPIARAVIRALGVKAAKGHIHAQRYFAQTLIAIEAENRAQSEAYMDGIIAYKKNWSAELNRRKELGLPLDPPVPHPDDIKYDMQRGTVEVTGPLTAQEKEKQDHYKAMLTDWRETKARCEHTLAEPLSCKTEQQHRDWVLSELEQCHVIIPVLEQLAGEIEDSPTLSEAGRRAARQGLE